MASEVVQFFALQKNQQLESALFRFQKGWRVRFVFGSSLLGQNIRLLVNYPLDDETFVRSTYREIEWKSFNESRPDDQTSVYADIIFKLAGTFRYQFMTEANPEVISGSGYFVVDPTMRVGEDTFLSLDSIQCQTVLSKCLGPFDTWKDRLSVAHKTGYNMIHFTPIQELGASKSAYSIKNQLKVSSAYTPSSGSAVSFKDVRTLVEFMRTQWGILSITDIVLNHTANETPWLVDHPECGFNLTNSPHLRPAYLFDRVLWHLTLDLVAGKWSSRGLSVEINSEWHLNVLRDVLKESYLFKAKIYEMFLIDVDEMVDEMRKCLNESSQADDGLQGEIKVIQDEKYRRYKSRVDLHSAMRLYHRNNWEEKDSWVKNCCDDFKRRLRETNNDLTNQAINHLDAGIENALKGIRYERLEAGGPKVKTVSIRQPLVPAYFTHYGPDQDLEKEEQGLYDSKTNVHVMAHNGWVMGDDALRNFAEPGSNVYLRREVIAWSDSVKLRFGKGPDDCPFLWNLMKEYVQETARDFHGIRLDNCHSTPFALAEYLLDAARRIRPDLFVIAELFTSSEDLDNLFVNRLGINSLIRESMAAGDSHELGRLVHRYGGEPVGSFSKPGFKSLQRSMSHAIFFDLTHDNESPMVKRTAYDFLPSSAIVSMACCATGSTRGYDELVPHHIHVVNESRVYSSWSEETIETPDDPNLVSYDQGILLVKKTLNELHLRLGQDGYSEVFVDQVDPNVVAITRHSPKTNKSVVLVARTCFKFEDPTATGFIRNITFPGKINEIIFEAKMFGKPQDHERSECVINGLKGFSAEIWQHLSQNQSKMVGVKTENGQNEIRFVKFVPSSVIAFDISLDDHHVHALTHLKEVIAQLGARSEIGDIVNRLDLEDINYVLFRIDQEEKDDGFGGGVYDIPGFAAFNYCGLAGLMLHWKGIRTNDDMGHPICENLRKGNWLPEYVANRLGHRDTTAALSAWLKVAFNHLSQIPRYMIPCYFDAIITPLYTLVLKRCFCIMSKFIVAGDKLSQALAFGGLAMVGFTRSSPLPPLGQSLIAPKPRTMNIDGIEFPVCATIAAGLPHFASGYMRNWGRDTFIALRGLLLVTGQYSAARNIILGFAGCLRHGLIPNLLDKGTNARFNCRDAVWFWLQCIKDYCQIAPNGIDILGDSVQRLYPTDDSEAKVRENHEQPLHQVMQEAIQKHFTGIGFIERNAGPGIDEQMTTKGFNVTAGINHDTGFVFGGNDANCGTWMDKMGSSVEAGNKGKPASPRDGSAVELVGLCMSIVSWLNKLRSSRSWPYEGVSDGNVKWTWSEWSDKIAANFEKHFWVAPDSIHLLVNKSYIYKDTLGATQEWQDFQLRPNFVVAMTVAPQMFDPEHARAALEVVGNVLLGPLGMKTLDPSDWNYRGDYDNSDHSSEYQTAHGFNYHQGPEWLWPVGYYLRARLLFGEKKPDAVKYIQETVSSHYQYLEKSPWLGLPELTNSNGADCRDSCPIQAWSHSTLLDVLYDVHAAVGSSR